MQMHMHTHKHSHSLTHTYTQHTHIHTSKDRVSVATVVIENLVQFEMVAQALALKISFDVIVGEGEKGNHSEEPGYQPRPEVHRRHTNLGYDNDVTEMMSQR